MTLTFYDRVSGNVPISFRAGFARARFAGVEAVNGEIAALNVSINCGRADSTESDADAGPATQATQRTFP